MPNEDETEKKKVPKFALIKRFRVGDDISLVDKAANEEVFLAIKSEDGGADPEPTEEEGFEVEEIHDELPNPYDGDANDVREEEKAVWTAAFINDLPDSSFAYVERGEKDSEGKTTPRGLRHLPFKDAGGAVDLPHLRNALARLPQTALPAAAKATARRILEAAAKTHGVGAPAQEKQEGDAVDEDEAGGMLPKIFQMLGSFLKRKRAEPAPKVEEKPKPVKKKYVYLPARASATASSKKEDKTLQDEQELTAVKEGEVFDEAKLLEELKGLKADLEERDKRIKALEDTVVEDKKSARKSVIQTKVEKWESQGKVSAAARELLVHALTAETAAYKSADGKEETLTPEEAMERFVEVNKGIVFGEVTKAATQADLGKWDGKTPADYAVEQLKLANKPIAQA